MKTIRIKTIESLNNLKIRDIEIPINRQIVKLIENESFVKSYSGENKFKTKEFLHSYLTVEISEENVKSFEDSINNYLKNAR